LVKVGKAVGESSVSKFRNVDKRCGILTVKKKRAKTTLDFKIAGTDDATLVIPNVAL